MRNPSELRNVSAVAFAMCLLSVGNLNAAPLTRSTQEKKPGIQSARLHLEVKASKVPNKNVLLNGCKIGTIPLSAKDDFEASVIEIPVGLLGIIATVNKIELENKPVDPTAPERQDIFQVRNLWLEVTATTGAHIESDRWGCTLNSFKTGILSSAMTGSGKACNMYLGVPMPVVTLTLPTDALGYLRQPLFIDKQGALYRNDTPRQWAGLEGAALPQSSSRTMVSFYGSLHEFIKYPVEYIVHTARRYNANCIFLRFLDDGMEEEIKRVEVLRAQGFKVYLLWTSGKLRHATNRLPGSPEYETFFQNVARMAKVVDCLGMDEWFLSPSMAITDGGRQTEMGEKFLATFERYSGYSDSDARWAFQNWTAADARAVKAWEYCAKVQNDIARRFVQVAKESNPNVKTWVSYITRNWNKYVTSIDRAVEDMDEILDCQTYWYGRYSQDSLNSALVTAPIGLGKILTAEHPKKVSWMGIEPYYTGAKSPEAMRHSWWRKCYDNTPEEATPYLALLYASSDGVFVQNAGAWMTTKGGLIRGDYVDEFADVVRLVSSLVPRIRSYVKSDVAYYYDPEANWETIRQKGRNVISRQVEETAVGFLQQFCDVDITSNVVDYGQVAYAGKLLPSKLDYTRQNIYLLFDPEHNEKGEKLGESLLKERLGLEGFVQAGTNASPADKGKARNNEGVEQCHAKDGTTLRDSLAEGKGIDGAEHPIRRIDSDKTSPDGGCVVCAQNGTGNVRVNSLHPSYTQQDVARRLIKKDADYFGWTKRDCPQVSGTEDIVAVAFREPRTAVVDFGDTARYRQVKIVIFNGRDGITRHETAKYARGMHVDLPPLAVLVAHGVK